MSEERLRQLAGGQVYHEVLIAGFGGQGVVLAGQLLAMAALAEKREVVWAPSYGPEMRGGPVHCTIIISSERIGSPEVSSADSLLLMDRAAADRFARRVKPGGLLIYNSTLISSAPQSAAGQELNSCPTELLALPAGEVAEAIGDLRVANVVMLGALLRRRPVVAKDSLIEAMRSTAGKAFAHLLEINLKALARGEELAG
jgi:2-oxoglutarate ferredoxin oxidoreductase subunit gamma